MPPAAYVEVNVFGPFRARFCVGEARPSRSWPRSTASSGIPEDRTYIRYTATTDWGWNDGNF